MKTKTFLILAAAALILAAPTAGWTQDAGTATQGTAAQSTDNGAATQSTDNGAAAAQQGDTAQQPAPQQDNAQ
ncbi:MAG: hypothetical protein KGQ70_02410 [Alphaproteobacteria bacterium]|nr:hypothetical protein [Alphaproteobacteria bacterium]